MTTREIDSIFELMNKLPGRIEEHIERFRHTLRNGCLLFYRENEEIRAYAELYRMQDIPIYPVLPWPKDNLQGKILYCFSAVATKNCIHKLISLAKKTFKDCTYIAYHREKKNHKLYLERI